jgi:hypothetical protein
VRAFSSFLSLFLSAFNRPPPPPPALFVITQLIVLSCVYLSSCRKEPFYFLSTKEDTFSSQVTSDITIIACKWHSRRNLGTETNCIHILVWILLKLIALFFILNNSVIYRRVFRDNSVGIATRYGPDGSGIESRWWHPGIYMHALTRVQIHTDK